MLKVEASLKMRKGSDQWEIIADSKPCLMDFDFPGPFCAVGCRMKREEKRASLGDDIVTSYQCPYVNGMKINGRKVEVDCGYAK